jgi:ABC-type multidrug transport system permease subunit
VFLREINNGMYDASSYFLAKVTSELPITFILATIFCIIVYWSIDLNTAHGYNFVLFWITVFLTNLATSSYALCMGVSIADK